MPLSKHADSWTRGLWPSSVIERHLCAPAQAHRKLGETPSAVSDFFGGAFRGGRRKLQASLEIYGSIQVNVPPSFITLILSVLLNGTATTPGRRLLSDPAQLTFYGL